MNEDLNKIVENISRALAEREKEWPERRAGYEAFQHEIDALYAALRQTRPFPGKITVPEFLDQPVFVCGYMKSGTSLTLHLLDGHSDLLTLPGDTHIIKYLEPASSYIQQEYERYWLARMVNPTGQAPYWFLENAQALADFLAYMRGFVNTQPDVPLINAVVYGLHKVCGGTPRFWIEKTPGNEHRVDQLLNYYPQARFIHVLRHPVTNFNSSCKLEKMRKRFQGNAAIIEGIIASHKSAQNNRVRLGAQKYHVVHYEDLIRKTEETMHGVAEFLDIEFQPGLAVPTIVGKPAAVNSIASAQAAMTKGEIHDQSLEAKEILEHLTMAQKIVIFTKALTVFQTSPYEMRTGLIKKYNHPLIATFLRFREKLFLSVPQRLKQRFMQRF